MLTKQTYAKSLIDVYQLDEKQTKIQKRNGNLLFRFDACKANINFSSTKGLDTTIFIIEGSMRIQKLSENEQPYIDNSLELFEGESVLMPKGRCYIWAGDEGVKYLKIYHELPKQFFDSFNVENIDIPLT